MFDGMPVLIVADTDGASVNVGVHGRFKKGKLQSGYPGHGILHTG